MISLFSEDIEQRGDLSLEASGFEDGERMPGYVGYANENESPELQITGIPADAKSFVLVCDDPDAHPVVGCTFDHWLVWDINPDIETIPRGWDPAEAEATVGYNGFVERKYCGPSPPDQTHGYRFKLLALDTELGLPPEASKVAVQTTVVMEADVLAATQLIGEYDPSQGTVF